MIHYRNTSQQKNFNVGKQTFDNVVIDYFEEEKLATLVKKIVKPEVKTILTNVERNAISLVYEDISRDNAVSVPAKFSFILYNRFKKFKGRHDKGLIVIIPFLFDEDVKKLEAFIIELAHFNYFDPAFIDWVEDCNFFSNSIY